jgi:hypothetical protein
MGGIPLASVAAGVMTLIGAWTRLLAAAGFLKSRVRSEPLLASPKKDPRSNSDGIRQQVDSDVGGNFFKLACKIAGTLGFACELQNCAQDFRIRSVSARHRAILQVTECNIKFGRVTASLDL